MTDKISSTAAADLANRLREVLLNGTWIAGTNFKHQLDQVSLQEANHQVQNLNTIAALTFHVNYYLEGILPVFKGGELTIKDQFSFDRPAISTEEEWTSLVDRLLNNAERFAKATEQLSDEQLQSVFVKKEYGSWQRNIEAMIEHAYYHLGQISLIRKLIAA